MAARALTMLDGTIGQVCADIISGLNKFLARPSEDPRYETSTWAMNPPGGMMFAISKYEGCVCSPWIPCYCEPRDAHN